MAAPSMRAGQRGFSLLEVLVAFAVLALSLGVLLQIFSRAMDGTATGLTYSRAVALAEAKLHAVGVEIPLAAGVYSGDPEGDLDWIVSIEPLQADGWLAELSDLPVYAVTAVASWPGPRGPRRARLWSVRLGEPL